MEILDTGIFDGTKPYVYVCSKCGHKQLSDKDYRKIHICENCGKVDIKLEEIYLYQFKPNIIRQKLNSELLRRKLQDEVDIKCIIICPSGKEEYIHNLSNSHIEHLIEELKKQK